MKKPICPRKPIEIATYKNISLTDHEHAFINSLKGSYKQIPFNVICDNLNKIAKKYKCKLEDLIYHNDYYHAYVKIKIVNNEQKQKYDESLKKYQIKYNEYKKQIAIYNNYLKEKKALEQTANKILKGRLSQLENKFKYELQNKEGNENKKEDNVTVVSNGKVE